MDAARTFSRDSTLTTSSEKDHTWREEVTTVTETTTMPSSSVLTEGIASSTGPRKRSLEKKKEGEQQLQEADGEAAVGSAEAER